MGEIIHQYGFWSLIPSVLAIVLAISTKRVYLSLLLGIFSGWLIINDFNFFLAFLDTLQAFVDVFSDAGNTRTIMFCALVGALILFIQRSGGVEGFILFLQSRLDRMEHQNKGRSRVMVQVFAWLTGILIFVESSISALTVGTLYRPIFDKLGISREKLAYITDSSSSPSSILIPLNAWGAFIMILLVQNGFDDPFAMMLKVMPYNFYPILALILVLVIVLSRKDFGPMKKAEERVRTTGKLLADGATPMVADELTNEPIKEGVQPRAINMVVPILIMVLLMPVMLAYTGWDMAIAERASAGFWSKVFYAIGQGSGSTAVLVAVCSSLVLSMLFYKSQGIMGIREMIDLTLKGISGLMPLALLMMFAFAISTLCKVHLETGQYVAQVTSAWLTPALLPAIVFVISCFIAFATGTSWGTFGIMLSIGIPMVQELNGPMAVTIAAVLGGGVFGDHCSPISDTTIISSMSSATDHIDHVRTQMPYALIAGGLAFLLYLILGFIG